MTLETDSRGPTVADRLLAGFPDERRDAAGTRPELKTLASPADGGEREHGHHREDREDDHELHERHPGPAAGWGSAPAAHRLLPSPQLVMSEASPSPPGVPSDPREAMSYSPCSPGLRYW